MASYVNVTYNHVVALQQWLAGTGAQATLDVRDFSMEVRHRGRYWRLHPLFQGWVDGRLVHLPQLTPGVEIRGFGGWRPYRSFTHPHSTDKLRFKDYLQSCGLRCPAWQPRAGEPPSHGYVLKARSGSFGLGLYGPWRGGSPGEAAGEGELFCEQFIQGRMLKAWYWGARPFFAQLQDYPRITGDGESSIATLLAHRMAAAGQSWDTLAQQALVKCCIAYQGCALDDVLPAGQGAWIDYRFGQLYPTRFGGMPQSDDQLEAVMARTDTQLADMGQALAQLLRPTVSAPVAITVDGVLDEEGRIWWLEMNTNSVLPPEAYAVMFADLFA